MYKFKSLMKISIILGFTLVFLGCATNKSSMNMDNNMETGITETGFSFTADGTSEGIILHFNNIPDNAIHLSVLIEDTTVNDQIFHHVLFWDNEAFEFSTPKNNLDELKEKSNLLIPFAKDGHKYNVSVSIYTDKNLNECTDYASTIVMAKGGIYLTNNPSLIFTDDNRNLALSTKPTFSREVEFDQNGLFSYSVSVLLDEHNSRGGGGNWNEYTFPAYEIYNGSQEYFGFTGYFPVIGSVQANLVYENMEYIIGVARTEEVFISF